jgi:hypothetical protein
MTTKQVVAMTNRSGLFPPAPGEIAAHLPGARNDPYSFYGQKGKSPKKMGTMLDMPFR